MNEGKVAGYYCLEGLGWAYCLVEKITTFEDGGRCPSKLKASHHAAQTTLTPKTPFCMMTCHTPRRHRLPLLGLLILLTALPLTAQRKRRATAPLPALPDTVYLLDHYQESRHWMRDPDKISRAKAKHNYNYKEMINAGWEFLAPAWRGVQDSASYPAFPLLLCFDGR